MQTEQLTATEVEKMRQIVAQHDSTSKKTTIHDLNNPPKEPYRFQKFPMVVYDLKNSHPAQDVTRPKANGAGTETAHIPAKVVMQVVRSEEHLQATLEGGWSEEAPAFTEEREETLSGPLRTEAMRVQSEIEATRPPSPADSPLDSLTKAELVALAKQIGMPINPAESKATILAALKAPESQVA